MCRFHDALKQILHEPINAANTTARCGDARPCRFVRCLKLNARSGRRVRRLRAASTRRARYRYRPPGVELTTVPSKARRWHRQSLAKTSPQLAYAGQHRNCRRPGAQPVLMWAEPTPSLFEQFVNARTSHIHVYIQMSSQSQYIMSR